MGKSAETLLSESTVGDDDDIAMMRFNHQLELNQTLTTLYLIIEVGRWDNNSDLTPNVQQRIGRT